MIVNRRLPMRLQLAGLGRALGLSDNDFMNPAPAYVDINGNAVSVPTVFDPVTGETRPDESVILLQPPAATREYQFDQPMQPESGYWASLPGVRSGAISPIDTVVVRAADMQPTGVLSVTPYQAPAPLPAVRADTYVGPLPPSMRAGSSAPAPVTPYRPAPAPAPAPGPGGGVDAGPAPAPGTAAPAAQGSGLLILAAMAALFFN